MATTEKRPRIPQDLANRIDRERGTEPFEQFVQRALNRSVGCYDIEVDPTNDKRFSVFGFEQEVVATAQRKHEAEALVVYLTRLDEAYNAIHDFAEYVEDDERDEASDLAPVAYKMASDIFDMADTLREAFR